MYYKIFFVSKSYWAGNKSFNILNDMVPKSNIPPRQNRNECYKTLVRDLKEMCLAMR